MKAQRPFSFALGLLTAVLAAGLPTKAPAGSDGELVPSLAEWRWGRTGAFSFICDDGWSAVSPSNRLRLAHIVASHGFRMTFDVIGVLAATNAAASNSFVSLHRAGHEIGLHGYHHESWASLDPVSASNDMARASLCLSNTIRAPIVSASYPFGGSTLAATGITHFVLSCRTAKTQPTNTIPADWVFEPEYYDLKTVPYPNTTQLAEGCSDGEYVAAVTKAVSNTAHAPNAWMTMMLHWVADGILGRTNANYGITTNALRRIVANVASYTNTLWVGTQGDIARYRRLKEGTTFTHQATADGVRIIPKTSLPTNLYCVPLTWQIPVPRARYDTGCRVTQSGSAITHWWADGLLRFEAAPQAGEIEVVFR